MNSISAKLSLLYILLALFNIAFFTITTFENQIDLITEIKKYEINDIGQKISVQLEKIMTEITKNGAEYPSATAVLNHLKASLQSERQEVIIFTENRKYVVEWSDKFHFKDEFLEEAARAYANRDFLADPFYTKIYPDSREILFYLPLKTRIADFEDFIFLFRLEMHDIDTRLGVLYRLMIIFIVVISGMHIIFAFFLNRMIINPLKSLTTRSTEISLGNYCSRVISRSQDEIGKLGQAFNTMAQSIEEKITQLDRKNKTMQKELQMAARVQQSIYPNIRSTEIFDIAIYHRPFIEVSGDYHNVVKLDNNRYGIIIADVSGHGVSAALITMLIKNQFEGIASQYTDSGQLMEYINNSFDNLMTDFDKFFTAFYLIIDKNRVVTFSNAAHPRAFVIRPGAQGFKILDTEGVFIGLPSILRNVFSSKSVRLRSGDKIVLYTDGITESLNTERREYGVERLQQTAIRNVQYSCDQMLTNIIANFESFCHPDARRDDETLIIIEMKDPQGGQKSQ